MTSTSSEDKKPRPSARPAAISETLSVSGIVPAPTPPLPRPQEPPERAPTPTTALIAQLQGLEVEAVEVNLQIVREAWQRGDQSVIADALFSQATLLETLGTKLLRVAGTEKHPKAIELYAGLALRALEQARKTLGTLAGLKEKPRSQTNVQVNVATAPNAAPNEILVGGNDEA